MKKNFVTTKIQKVVHRTSRGEAKLVEKRVSLPVQDDTLHDPNIGHLRPCAIECADKTNGRSGKRHEGAKR